VRLESLAGVFANNHFVGEREGRHGSEIGRKNSDTTTMATTVMKPGDSKPAATALVATADEPRKSPKHYRGFVAGVFSGIAKLSGIHHPSSVERKWLTRVSRPPFRHHKSASPDHGEEPIPRACRLPHADAPKRRLRGVVQGRNTSAGGVDVHGFDVCQYTSLSQT
jgi:hypothetical protein